MLILLLVYLNILFVKCYPNYYCETIIKVLIKINNSEKYIVKLNLNMSLDHLLQSSTSWQTNYCFHFTVISI